MLEGCLIGTGVDDIKDVTLLHFMTLLELRSHHIARHAWPDFDPFDRLETAREFVELRHRLRYNLGGLNRWRCSGSFGSLVARAGAEDQGGEWSHECDGNRGLVGLGHEESPVRL
jgi:hypothetical protein